MQTVIYSLSIDLFWKSAFTSVRFEILVAVRLKIPDLWSVTTVQFGRCGGLYYFHYQVRGGEFLQICQISWYCTLEESKPH